MVTAEQAREAAIAESEARMAGDNSPRSFVVVHQKFSRRAGGFIGPCEVSRPVTLTEANYRKMCSDRGGGRSNCWIEEIDQNGETIDRSGCRCESCQYGHPCENRS